MELSNLIAKDLLSIRAVFFRPEEPFTWASGIKSPVYCDNRLTLTDVAVRTDVEQGLASLVKENYPDVEVHIEHAESLSECKKMLMLAKAGKKNGCLIEGMACPGGCVAGAGTNIAVPAAAKAVSAFKESASRKIPDQK